MPTETHETITVRWADPGDRDAIAGLLLETKQHYDEGPADTGRIGPVIADWLEAKPGHALFVIAHAGDIPAGYASVAVAPPGTGLAATLYLKELFVSAGMRGRGIGHELLAFLAKFCVAENVERIDLTTAAGNAAGIRFYEREGAAVQHQKICLRFETASLERLAADPQETG